MNRREFVAATAALAATSALPRRASSQTPKPPAPDATTPYIETTPVPEYSYASPAAYEAFQDIKFGVRIHWGIYSIWHRGAESWPYLPMSFEDRQDRKSVV